MNPLSSKRASSSLGFSVPCWTILCISCRSSTRSMICLNISSKRVSLLSPRTGANLTSVASSIAFLRCGKRQEFTVREKSCSIAMVKTPTWLSLSSFCSRARLSRVSSSWLSARCCSSATWHLCSWLLMARCSFCSFVCTRVHSSRTRSNRADCSSFACVSSWLPPSNVACRFMRTSMSSPNSSWLSWITCSRKFLYCAIFPIFPCSVSRCCSFSRSSFSRARISPSRRRLCDCSSSAFFSLFSICASRS
mmetsp:Transcript_10271/g.24681  ORF Transcript_10271/g.24681 Transcript_10271/m.24681 type:complete len:250 (-) Transcript_10271:403-1152(-)